MGAKLKPLRKLKQGVDHAHSHAEEDDDVKLSVLVAKFAVVEESWIQKCMTKIAIGAIVVAIGAIVVAFLIDASGILHRPAATEVADPGESPSGKSPPIALSAMSCGSNGGGVGVSVGGGIGLAITETADGAAFGGAIGAVAGLVVGVGMAIAGLESQC